MLRMRKPPPWYDRRFRVKLLETRAIVQVENRFYHVEEMIGKKMRVPVTGHPNQLFSTREVHPWRYRALQTRQTLCNHMNLAHKYYYNAKNPNCHSCRCSVYCARHYIIATGGIIGGEFDVKKLKMQLVIRDKYAVAEYFRRNKPGY